MDRHFTTIIAGGIIALGVLGIIGGVALILVSKEAVTGTSCIGLATTAMGTMGGVLIAPRVQQNTQPSPN